MPLRPRRWIGCFAALAALIPSAASCARPQDTGCSGAVVQLRQDGVLTVGMDLDHPPFAFTQAGKDDPTGIEVDLVRVLADRLGLELRIVGRTSAALVPDLLAHRLDLSASGLRDDAELGAELCLSDPYLDADLGIVVGVANPLGIRGQGDLAGRAVGVAEGSEAERWARSRLSGSASVRPYAAPEDLGAALERGEVDAAVDDLAVLRYAYREQAEVAVVAAIDLASSYVLAAAPDNGGLMELVNDALTRIAQDGTLRELRRRWLGT